jgi:small subunit ribosomal protein S17
MKLFQGTVTRTSEKTLAVEVVRKWIHPKYQKIVKSTKKYLVHDETNAAKVGEVINFQESRPYSKRKRFAIVTPDKKVKN